MKGWQVWRPAPQAGDLHHKNVSSGAALGIIALHGCIHSNPASGDRRPRPSPATCGFALDSLAGSAADVVAGAVGGGGGKLESGRRHSTKPSTAATARGTTSRPCRPTLPLLGFPGGAVGRTLPVERSGRRKPRGLRGSPCRAAFLGGLDGLFALNGLKFGLG